MASKTRGQNDYGPVGQYVGSYNPTKAIAEMIGEHEGRLDALADRLHHVECVHEMKSSSQNVEVS